MRNFARCELETYSVIYSPLISCEVVSDAAGLLIVWKNINLIQEIFADKRLDERDYSRIEKNY
ncbi:MAG: hypothetical protein IJU48_01645 [Synergistaceae bacterium]|nr:hypothetical protein [Synergistaceae bacterium]